MGTIRSTPVVDPLPSRAVAKWDLAPVKNTDTTRGKVLDFYLHENKQVIVFADNVLFRCDISSFTNCDTLNRLTYK